MKNVRPGLTEAVPEDSVHLNFTVVFTDGEIIALTVGVLNAIPTEPDSATGISAAEALLANMVFAESTILNTKNPEEALLKAIAEKDAFISQAEPDGKVTLVSPISDNPLDAITFWNVTSVAKEKVSC